MVQRRTVDTRELRATGEGRIDAILAAAAPDMSRARIQRLIAADAVTLNGAPARKSDRVMPGDVLVLRVAPIEHEEPAAAPDLDVLFEDDAFVAIDKPAGCVVHGTAGESSPAVSGWFLQRYPGEASRFDAERPGIVHRLDKDTTGVVLLAKTPAAQAFAGEQFEFRTVSKLYLAITDGVPERPEALIDAPVGRHVSDRTKMAVSRRGREARTGYEVLGHDGRRALLLVRLYTGRTHQIRVHLAAIGTPVSGDSVYGSGSDGRQLLHAWRLALPHPAGGSLTVTAPAPADVSRAIRELGHEAVALEYSQPIAAAREAAEES